MIISEVKVLLILYVFKREYFVFIRFELIDDISDIDRCSCVWRFC